MTSGKYRDQFHIPQHNGRDAIYLCGNSLGLQPKKVKDYVNAELEDWAMLGVEGHLHARHPWLPYHEFLTAPMARLVGALPGEVVVMNSLTVNLHLLMASFYRPTNERYKILIESDAFPSDRYAVASQAEWHGYNASDSIINWKPEPGEHTLRIETLKEILAREGDRIALMMIGGVNYYTGQYFNIKEITALGHQYGITVGWDMAHAAGNVALQLHDWDVDFAAWCSYKYLNSGPGSLGSIFVHEKHGNDLTIPRLSGWWGHNKETRFKMRDDFDPLPGAEGWQLSNPPILPMAAMRASLEIFEAAGIANLQAIARVNVQRLYDALVVLPHVQILTPSNPDERGSQLSLFFEENGRALFDHLSAQGVIADWREPNVIRIAAASLYNTTTDIDTFINILQQTSVQV
jgi:kynureninase